MWEWDRDIRCSVNVWHNVQWPILVLVTHKFCLNGHNTMESKFPRLPPALPVQRLCVHVINFQTTLVTQNEQIQRMNVYSRWTNCANCALHCLLLCCLNRKIGGTTRKVSIYISLCYEKELYSEFVIPSFHFLEPWLPWKYFPSETVPHFLNQRHKKLHVHKDGYWKKFDCFCATTV